MERGRGHSGAGLLIGLGMVGGGVWLSVRLGDSERLGVSLLGTVGLVMAAQGAWFAFRELRRLLDPERARAIEDEEAERQAAAGGRGVTRGGVAFAWLLALPFVGFSTWYALDDSGRHGERTVATTLVIVGLTLAAVGFAVWATLARRRQHRLVRDTAPTLSP